MNDYSPAATSSGRPALVDRLDGLLFFPVSPCDDAGGLAVDVLRKHVADGVEAGAGAVFVCCGTGEFPALALDDYATAVRAAVDEVGGRVPVLSGVGYGTSMARRFLSEAEQAGVDGVLVLPPYLLDTGQEGLLRHYESLADAAATDLILYQRDNAVFTPESVATLAAHERIVGLKDGRGDLDLMQRIISAVRSSRPAGTGKFRFLNGLPTAEISALAYRGLGVDVYSSAVFCFAPRLALTFFHALRTDDRRVVDALIDGFYRPLVELRRLGKGYTVSLVKAAVRFRDLEVGAVRAPFVEPAKEHLDRLALIIERGEQLLAEL